MADLKTCVNLVSSNSPFPGCREDFPSEEAYREWRSAELAALQDAMLDLLKICPDLTRPGANEDASTVQQQTTTAAHLASPPSFEAGEAYVGRRTSRVQLPIAEQFASRLTIADPANGSHDLDSSSSASASPVPPSPDGSLTFVPSDVRQAYQRLLQLLLSNDLAAMSELDPSEEVPLRILSTTSTQLLGACATWWRVMATYRYVAFLEDMNSRYESGEMPVLECVLEALSDFEPLHEKFNVKNWPPQDRETAAMIASRLFDALLRNFYETLSEQQSAQAVTSAVQAIESLTEMALFDEAVPVDDLDNRFEELRSAVRRASEYLYSQKREAEMVQHPELSLLPFFNVLEWIKRTTKTLDKNYRQPLLSAIDVPALFLEKVPAMFLEDLSRCIELVDANRRPQPLYSAPADQHRTEDSSSGLKDGEVMGIHEGVRELVNMQRAFCPQYARFRKIGSFGPTRKTQLR